MTSANLSDEPMATGNDEARERLRGIADLFLVHDREIDTRCDDSVARVIAGRPVVLRRSRGYVPRALPLRRPVVAAGAGVRRAPEEHLLPGGRRQRLPRPAHRRSREPRGLRRLRRGDRAHGALPRHPAGGDRPRPAPRLLLDALRASRGRSAVKVAVQHHHAHVAAAMAEHGGRRPGARLRLGRHRLRHRRHGLGRRAAAGELRRLRAPRHASGRFASPAATRRSARSGGSPWRCSTTPSTARRRSTAWRSSSGSRAGGCEVVRQLRRAGFHAPAGARRRPLLRRARRARPRPAVGALRGPGGAGVERRRRRRARAAAIPSTSPTPIAAASCEVDLRPTGPAHGRRTARRRAARDPLGRFHNTLADVAVAINRSAAQRLGHLPVVLTGGCFQNALLAERVWPG